VKERKRRAENPQRARDILKRWRDRTLPERKAVKKARYDRNKVLVFAAYGGFKCACCGETEPTMLTIDHKNEDGAAFRRKIRGVRWSHNFMSGSSTTASRSTYRCFATTAISASTGTAASVPIV
jgi:hypothetical protein